MAESKRTFQSARMDKDIDDRILPSGTYRDALNVSVDFSEDANVGALENLKGNELIANQDITGLSAATNPNAEVIGSVAHPEENKIYYFVSGDNSDGIFEYDISTGNVSTIIIDSSSTPLTPAQLNFTFEDSLSQASVALNGGITVTASFGEIESLTEDFNTTVLTNTTRSISVRVRVPSGYSNSGDYVYGFLTATQQAVSQPTANSITVLEPTELTATSVTLNAAYTQDAPSLTDIGFYYTTNTGGSSSANVYSNKFVIRDLVGHSANISSGSPLWTDPFDTVEPGDVTVIDGNSAIIDSSNYTYERHYGPQPSTIKFEISYLPILPITIAQTSSLTALSDALVASEVVSNGTQVSLSTITSPFSKNVTGLTSNTEHAAVAYVTNAQGTTYSDVLTFKTAAAPAYTYNVLPDDRIFIFPTADDDQYGANLYPGYREYEKSGGGFYFAAVASKASGLYNDYSDLTSGVTWSNSGTNFTYNDTETQNFAKTSSVNVSTASAGVYTVTAAKSGLTSGTTQIVVGSPSGTRYKSTFTLNFAKTGTGTVPFVAVFDHGSSGLHWNHAPETPLAEFSIGPFNQGQDGVIMIPLSTDNTVVFGTGGTTSQFNSGVFDPESLDVSITGKTEGTDYEYYIATEAMSIWGASGVGPIPAVIIEADPYVLNGGVANATHTLNITYNY